MPDHVTDLEPLALAQGMGSFMDLCKTFFLILILLSFVTVTHTVNSERIIRPDTSDKLLVRFKKDVPRTSVLEKLAQKAMIIIRYYPLINAYLVEIKDGVDKAKLIGELKEDPAVEYVEWVYKRYPE